MSLLNDSLQQNPWYTPRPYLHFDNPLSRIAAERLVTNSDAVARHSFYPLLGHTIRAEKIHKRAAGGIEKKEKLRPIAIPSHGAAHIFAYYGHDLALRYEQVLADRHLGNCVTAFRSLGRNNIHFANEAFETIRTIGACFVLTSDIGGFFDNLRHDLVHRAWCTLLGVERLPDDHFAVFKAITKFCQVDRESAYKVLGIDADILKSERRQRLCTPRQFREVVRENGLCVTNRTGKGIPQGTPISPVLANLYLLEFDTALSEFAAKHNGIYRRYCDDLLVVLPTPELRAEAVAMVNAQLRELGLEAHPKKTEEVDFLIKAGRLAASKPLNYLGFTFDGRHKRIRPSSIARFYKKMRAGVGRAKAMQWRASKRTGVWVPLRKKQLYWRYSYIGRRNFLAYAFRAADTMKDEGIRKQVKAHWAKLQNLIEGGSK